MLNQAGGLIEGAINMGKGDDSVVNQGTLTGNVSLGENADTFDTSQGTWTGWADLGWGDDHFLGSAAGDVVRGGRNSDTLSGNGGNDLLLGGTGNDTIAGDAGNDGLYGETGDDALTTSEGDRAYGGEGDDTIIANDLSFALVDGGGGFDTLRLGGSAVMLDLAAAIATGRLLSIEAIRPR